MNIKQLRIFVEVCEQGSFTRAANKLFMTQQAVSHSIVTLENSLNCTLFDRNAGALLLTESGIFLRDNCQTLLREDDLLQYKMENYIAKGEVIRVGYGFGMLRNLPLNFFVNFQKKFPRYSIHGTEMLNLTCEMGVDSKELDVAFTIGPVDESRFSCCNSEDKYGTPWYQFSFILSCPRFCTDCRSAFSAHRSSSAG